MSKQKRLFRLTILVCLVSLLLSLALNLLLFLQARHYYLLLNKTTLDPLGLRAFNNSSIAPAASTSTVVFFGDSRAEMWRVSANLKGFSFVNRGIGSQTSAQVLGRFEYHVLPLNPDIIIVQVGINDLKAIPLFPEQKAVIIANCKNNIQKLIVGSLDSGATVILTTIFPIGPVPLTRQPFWSPDISQAVDEVNAYLRSLKAKNVLILDAYSLLVEKERVKSNYVYDTLHINQRGYERLNQELTKVLANWLTSKRFKGKL